MDIHELTQRVIAILTAERVVDANGVPQIPAGFDAVRAELEALIRDNADLMDLVDLAKAMDVYKEMMTDPMLIGALNDATGAQAEPDPEIFDAIETGDVAVVRRALKTCDVNARYGEYQATALYRAMSGFEVSVEIMHALLDAGADPRKGLSDSNVLHGLGFAVIKGIAPEDICAVIKRCVAAGADLEQRSKKLQWTPLICAVSEWNPIATEALLMAGADIHARAGDVAGVCFSGSDVFDFADGDDDTMAVLKSFVAFH